MNEAERIITQLRRELAIERRRREVAEHNLIAARAALDEWKLWKMSQPLEVPSE